MRDLPTNTHRRDKGKREGEPRRRVIEKMRAARTTLRLRTPTHRGEPTNA